MGKLYPDYILPSLIFLLNLFVQNYNLGKLVFTFTDEGVFLYSAKLISQGFIPYRDFFLSHPFYGLLPISLFFKAAGNNLNLLHFVYTTWVFITIFPIYFLIVKATKNRFAALLALLLYSTFPEMVQWDSHFFALRQFSLPLLAFALLFISKKRHYITGLFLGFFSIILVTNFFIALSLLIAVFITEFLKHKTSLGTFIKEKQKLLTSFFSVSFLGYIIILLIPSGFDNLIGYQTQQPFLPYDLRFAWIKIYFLSLNWPILIGGLVSSLIVVSKFPVLTIFNLLTLFITIFLGGYFYPHYLVSIAVGFTLSFGIFLSRYTNNWKSKVFIGLAFFLIICTTSIKHLKQTLVNTTSPEFFKTIEILKSTPSPIFSLEPIYALYANKELIYHYHTADMRYYRVLGKNLDEKEYLDILNNSQTVLLEPFAYELTPQQLVQYIYSNYQAVYTNGINSIYVKK